MASFAFGALLGGAQALAAEGATLAGGIGAGLQSGLLFTGVETLIKDGVQFVENQFRKPETSPLHDNVDINEKTVKGQRQLLKKLIDKKNNV